MLLEYPLLANALSLLAGRSIVDSHDWRPDRGTRFTVVERASGTVVCRSVAPAFFCYHQVNAFEDDGALLVDLPAIARRAGAAPVRPRRAARPRPADAGRASCAATASRSTAGR